MAFIKIFKGKRGFFINIRNEEIEQYIFITKSGKRKKLEKGESKKEKVRTYKAYKNT